MLATVAVFTSLTLLSSKWKVVPGVGHGVVAVAGVVAPITRHPVVADDPDQAEGVALPGVQPRGQVQSRQGEANLG